MAIENPAPSQEKSLTPEVIEILKNRFEQAKAELILENVRKANRADEIREEDLRRDMKARLGYIPVEAGEITEELAELEVSLN